MSFFLFVCFNLNAVICIYIYMLCWAFITVLGFSLVWMGFSLAVGNGGCSLVAVHRIFIGVHSLLVEHRL